MNKKKISEKSRFGFAAVAIGIALLFCAMAAFSQEVPDGNVSAANSTVDMLFMLIQIQADVQGSLNDLDSDVANASQDLSATGLEGTAARDVLRKLLESNPNLAEAVTFSKDGKVLMAECSGCFEDGKDNEGADTGSQDLQSIHSTENLSKPSIEQIARVLKTKAPDFSEEYQMTEGYNGTALTYPVFSLQGELQGGIATTIVPDKLMNALVAPQLCFDIYNRSNITDYSFWLMHLDGLIAYDRDESQIGKYLFEDPLYKPYPSLLALGEKMITARSGHGYYSFQVTEGNKRVVTKESYWTTAGLHPTFRTNSQICQ